MSFQILLKQFHLHSEFHTTYACKSHALQLYTLLTSLTHRSTRDQRLQYQPTPYQVSHPGDPSEMQLFLTTVQRFDRTAQYQPSFDLALTGYSHIMSSPPAKLYSPQIQYTSVKYSIVWHTHLYIETLSTLDLPGAFFSWPHRSRISID